jgi:hypothetical protein
MAGGEMQLIAPATSSENAQMIFLVGSPQMSYFKTVYRRHTMFAMESITETFTGAPTLQQSSRSTVSCVFSGRRADLLKEVYFSFELPDIYSFDFADNTKSSGTNNLSFQWIPNFAQYMVHKASATLDSGRAIDEVYGEWLDVNTELSSSDSHKALQDRMIGNTAEFTSPRRETLQLVVSDNNIGTTLVYPSAGDEGAKTFTDSNRSIARRRFYVPLRFWFTRNGQTLPLCALRFQVLTITLELRALDELYQVLQPDGLRFVSPAYYRAQRGSSPSPTRDPDISNFLKPEDAAGNTNKVDLRAALECNYVFLDQPERLAVTLQSHKLLVEQVFRFSVTGVGSAGVGTNNVVLSMPLNNPTKEFVFFLRRSDAATVTNAWSTFTDSGSTILNKARIVWNKNFERQQDKDASYFQYIQPYQHHTGNPRDGLYTYSFALYPEKLQPSGQYNTSIITDNQLVLSVFPPALAGVEYEAVAYAVVYNIFEAMCGVGQLKFTP